MIPLKLEIKNFLSYGSEIQTINFEPYNLICLSGKNGHGKSAMLDAITWAIWGQARKILGSSKPDQGLLRMGQRTMVVILDFAFNKNIYRIKREFTFAYNKPYALLEFGLLEENANVLLPLTDKTIKDTQQKIEELIGLDYDSFINSAFLRQGHSNEFSKKSPKERKEIFANILGLDKYENLRKFALEKIKIEIVQKEGLSKVQEHIEKELESFETVKNNLANLKNEIEKTNILEQNILDQLKLLEDEKTELINHNQQYQILEFQLKNSQKDFETQNKKLKLAHLEWKNLHHKFINTINIDELKKEKEKLVNNIATHQKNFENSLKQKEEYLKLKEQEQLLLKTIEDQHTLVMQEKKLFIERSVANLNNLNEKIKELTSQHQNLKIELKNIDSLINVNDKEKSKNYSSVLEKNELLFERRKLFYQKFITQGNSATSQLNDLEKKKKLSLDENNPCCPLCEQTLSTSRKKFLKQQLEKQESFLKHRLKRLTGLIKELKDLLIIQHEEINNQKKIIEQKNIEHVKLEELKKNKYKVEEHIQLIDLQTNEINKNINQITQDIEITKKEIERLNQENSKIVSKNPDYQKILTEIELINKNLQYNTYNQLQHQTAMSKLKELENLCQNNNKAELALLREHKKNEISQLCKSLKILKQEIFNLQKNIEVYKELNVKEEALKTQEFEISQKKSALSKTKENLISQLGSLENQKQKLEQLIEEHKTQKKTISKFEESIEEYKIISTALSKDGIQALLIEDAIPEVEDEANQILSKLTDNQAQIFIESLRDLKKGGTKETLDIKISDSHGIRPYEMFSGGEAFRIDFALRIAISKLLARRAGTSLQTLIIDEGFGSQDEEGLTHIMDSIYKIQEDFAKIIIVSHLPSMKDQFPVHFMVEKSPSGSKVKVIEQG